MSIRILVLGGGGYLGFLGGGGEVPILLFMGARIFLISVVIHCRDNLCDNAIFLILTGILFWKKSSRRSKYRVVKTLRRSDSPYFASP